MHTDVYFHPQERWSYSEQHILASAHCNGGRYVHWAFFLLNEFRSLFCHPPTELREPYEFGLVPMKSVKFSP